MNIPSDLLYTKDHEWIKIENGIATVGITDYAQGELGDIVYLELPEVESDAVQGNTFGTIEAVKTVADLYAPLSGTIIKTNKALDKEPELVNHDPYGEGWLCKIELSSSVESKNLLSADEYNNILG